MKIAHIYPKYKLINGDNQMVISLATTYDLELNLKIDSCLQNGQQTNRFRLEA
jgi:hypothetical protein